MMTIDGSHITIDKGDNGVIGFVFSHKKHAIPLGVRNFRLIIKKHKEDTDGSAILDVTKTAAHIEDNYIAFSVSSIVSDNEPGSYFYGLRVFTDGYVNTIHEGLFTIRQGTYKGVNV